MKFPLIGSAVLFGLFLLFKFLPTHLINTVLTGYFVVIGAFAVTVTILPFIVPIFPHALAEKRTALGQVTIPYFYKASVHSGYLARFCKMRALSLQLL